MIILDKFLANVFGKIPDINNYDFSLIDFRYQSYYSKCDEIIVYYNQKYLFKFKWLYGYEAPMWSKLSYWYKLYVFKAGIVK